MFVKLILKYFKQIPVIFIFFVFVWLNVNHSRDVPLDSNERSSTVYALIRGGGSKKYPKKFDANFHRILRKGFPDSAARIEFETAQLKLYKSARFKLNTLPLVTTKKKMKTLSPEEKDAIDYVTGKGFYRYQQNLQTKPNKFDTRESFLLKMHDPANRDRFLKSLK